VDDTVYGGESFGWGRESCNLTLAENMGAHIEIDTQNIFDADRLVVEDYCAFDMHYVIEFGSVVVEENRTPCASGSTAFPFPVVPIVSLSWEQHCSKACQNLRANVLGTFWRLVVDDVPAESLREEDIVQFLDS
jgi:hypothetical protein